MSPDPEKLPKFPNVVPLRPLAQPISDISRFENFVVPAHPLTKDEQAIYRRLAADWARLDATAQTTLYAAFLQGTMTPFLEEVFANGLECADHVSDRFTNPGSRAKMRMFSGTMQDLDTRILLGFKTTSARKMDAILAEDYPPEPPKRNLFQRLFGW